jgi:predicted dithiol-disulfide oxidoreductase (DUF899 family)
VAERTALLAAEKQLTRAYDALAQQRRALPWVRIDKTYSFDTVEGPRTLAQLFDGRSQLIVNHFMFGPDWTEGCVGCSFGADHVDGALPHLTHHDVSYVAVSRAPLEKLMAYKRRMGWRFNWVSSAGSDFNYDFGVSFTPQQLAAGEVAYNYRPARDPGQDMPGTSVFHRSEAGEIFHTYSCFGRGDEQTIGTYMLLDLTPKGRNETGPRGNLTDWVHRHDAYDDAPKGDDRH